MFTILYIATSLIAAPVTCKPKTPLTLTAEAGSGAKIKLPKLPSIAIVSADDKFAKIESDKGAGYAKIADLKKVCPAVTKEIEALASSAAAAEPPPPEPTSPLAVAKNEPVETPIPVKEEPKPEPAKPAPPPPPPPKIDPAATNAGAERVKRAAKADNKTKIAVLDLKGSDSVPKELRESVGAVIPESLDGLGPFKAISKQDIEQMLALEAMKESVGCSDVACLAEIGGALGADFMVTGSLIRVDQTYMLQLQLLNIRTSRPESRITREYSGGPQGLFEEARVASKMLVRDLLEARSGTLELKVSEESATVRVDGSIIGTSPLKPVALAGGLHTLTVEREGFVRHSQDISVSENQTTKADVMLNPSPEFRKKYLGQARLMRGLAWGFSVLGLCAVGAGVAIIVVDGNNERQLKQDMIDYNASAERSQTTRESLQAKQANIALLDGVAIGAMIFGAVSIGVGVTLFAVGDNPSKYDEAKTSTSVSSLELKLGVGRLGLVYHY
ncbi:MAG: PEGA domain-containing protein [Deltaproteobacteria bacterium]|nr:PEGA domain-containing protein [Deltaproteobacteria bacterium]